MRAFFVGALFRIRQPPIAQSLSRKRVEPPLVALKGDIP